MTKRIYTAALAAVLSLGGLFAAAQPASARDRYRHDYRSRRGSEDTYRVLTYGLGAATVYGAVKRDPLIAGLGAAGTLYSYSKWKGAVRDRHRDEWGYGYRGRRSRYDRGYRTYDRGYYPSYSRNYDRGYYPSYSSYPTYGGYGRTYGRDYSSRDCDRGYDSGYSRYGYRSRSRW